MDLAELAIRVDTSDVRRASGDLDKLDQSGRRTSGEMDRMESSGRRGAAGIGAVGAAGAAAGRSLGGLAGMLAGGLGLGALGSSAISMAADFEGSLNDVQAKLGATETVMGNLRTMAQDLGATTAFSAAEAADGMGYLAQAGLDANEIMKAMPTTLNLAAAAGLDLASAADIATNVMGGFGMSVEELPRIADVMAATSSKANTSVEEMAGAMKRVGPVASSFGVSLEESASAIGILANNGIKADEAGTGLAAMFTRLVNPVGEGKKAFADLGLSLDAFQKTSADGRLEFVGIAEAMDIVAATGANAKDMMRLFGQEAGPKLISLVAAGGDAIRELEQDVQSTGQAAEMAATKMQGLPGALKNAASAWEGLNLAIMAAGGTSGTVSVVNALTDAMRYLATDGIEYMQARVLDVQIELRNFRTNLEFSDDLPFVALRAMGDALSQIGGYLAPLVPYLDDFGVAAAAIAVSAGGITLVAGALSAVAAVVLSPVVLGVAAVAAGAVLIRENWDGIASWWSGLWDGLAPETKAAFDQVLAVGEEAWEAIKRLFSGPELGDSASGAMGGVVNAFASAWGAILTGINTIVPIIADAIDSAFGYIIDAAPDIAKAWDTVFPKLVAVVKEGFGLITTVVDAAWPLIESAVRTGWDVVTGILDIGLAALRGDFKTMFEEIQNLVYGFVGNIASGALKLVGAVGRIGWDVGKSLVGSISDAIETGQSLVGEAFARLLESIPVIGGRMAATVRDWMKESGEAVAEGYADGMKSGEALVAASAESMGSLPAYIVSETMQIRSPSLVMLALGLFIGRGLAQGIDESASEVAAASGRVSDAAVGGFESLSDGMKELIIAYEDGSFGVREYSEELEKAGGPTRMMVELAEDYADKLNRANVHVKTLATEQHLQNIALTQGADAAEAARLRMDLYSEAQIENILQTERNMEIQQEFHTALVDSISNADSIKDAFSSLGDFMKDWLKEKISYFAANTITAIVGFGTGEGGGMGGILGAIGGMFGGGGSTARDAPPIPGLAGAAGASQLGAATGLASVAGALAGIAGPAALAVGGLTLVRDMLGGNDQSMGESLRVIQQEVPKTVDALDDTRVDIGRQLTALGVDISSGFDTRVAGIFSDAVDDIDFGVSARNLQDGLVHFTGRAYAEALTELDPRVSQLIFDSMGLVGFTMETVLTRAADLSEEQVARMGEAFAEAATTVGAIAPLLEQSGAAVGSSADDIAVSAILLADAMGGVGPATDALTFFLSEFVPEADRAAAVLDEANSSVGQFNEGIHSATQAMYGGADGIINTRDELYALWRSLDPASPAAARVLEFAGSVVAVEDAAEQARVETEAMAEAQIDSLNAVTDAAAKLNLTFDAAAPLAASAAAGLTELMGGMDSFESATNSYFNNFYSQQEQQDISLASSAGALRAWNDTLTDADLAMASVKDGTIDSKNEFRRYVESLDLTTDAGRRAYASAMTVQDALLDVADGGKTLDKTIDKLPDHLVDAGSIMANSMDSTARELKRIADVLVGAFGGIGRSMVDTTGNLRTLGGAISGIASVTRATVGGVTSTVGELGEMNRSLGRLLGGLANGRRLGSASIGMDRVPYSGMRVVTHQDEMIVTASVSEQLRKMGVTATSIPPALLDRFAANAPSADTTRPTLVEAPRQSGDERAVVRELRAMREELAALRAENAAMEREAQSMRATIASATAEQTDEVRSASRQARLGQRQLGRALSQ